MARNRSKPTASAQPDPEPAPTQPEGESQIFAASAYEPVKEYRLRAGYFVPAKARQWLIYIRPTEDDRRILMGDPVIELRPVAELPPGVALTRKGQRRTR